MAVICHCPNCLGEVIGRFQRSCTVCGREIPVELRMAEVPVLEATPVEVRRASSLQQRVLAGILAEPAARPAARDGLGRRRAGRAGPPSPLVQALSAVPASGASTR
jgi:hypothetical protein